MGRHLVEAAIAENFSVTLFNRGVTNKQLFAQAERVVQIFGDRNAHSSLPSEIWDAVVDTCGFNPANVQAMCSAVYNKTALYVFISSANVYKATGLSNKTENAPLADRPGGSGSEMLGVSKNYASLKAASENVVLERFKDRALVIRSGLIAGPHDSTKRFTYWPRRIRQGGEILAPGRPDRPIQFIDARDLANFIVRLIINRKSGIYNAVGPQQILTMKGLLDKAMEVLKSTGQLIWTPDHFLAANGITSWRQLPLWIDESRLNNADIFSLNCDKSFADGLTLRDISETLHSILPELDSIECDNYSSFLSKKQETDLLKMWKANLLD